MLTNIKAEIIYYTIPTDFELEFHINGCCPMRLLTHTADNRNQLITALSRAFSHNKVVIITGPLDNDIIDYICKSIGFECEVADAQKFYFTEKKIDSVIGGSVPLITENGVLGGCIVESGPQALILVTSEKTTQREVIKKLVEPYLRALSDIENPPMKEEITEDINSQSQVNLIDASSETVPLNTVVNDDFEIVTDNKLTFDEEEIDVIFHEPQKNSKKGLYITTLIITLLLLTIIGYAAYKLLFIPLNEGISIIDNFKEVFSFIY